MPEIPDISTTNIDIRDVTIPEVRDWIVTPPLAVPPSVPITEQVGVPIVDIPGCVEAHESNNKSNTVSDDDENGVVTYCDAGVPSFNPLDYDSNKLDFEYEAPVPPISPTKTPEVKTPPIPDTGNTSTAKVECPTEAQKLKEPVGHIKGDKKVTEYRLVGKECIQVTEKLSIPDQIVGNIPSAGAVTATASIAVVATTSALLAKPLADLLLKAIKPAVKKLMKKIANLRGKKTPIESVMFRRQEQRIRNRAIRKLKGKE
tara:strand:+ start:1479 stop:2255 length:777 start_codon:yes stop_codon:yes gene_type:complete